ncbi:hypothetical protein POVCU1_067070 [Plasmodium ovale curtisi]|nr:hypothetical protein POVCU1_067070 [Plasmodium ovale curtisi]
MQKLNGLYYTCVKNTDDEESNYIKGEGEERNGGESNYRECNDGDGNVEREDEECNDREGNSGEGNGERIVIEDIDRHKNKSISFMNTI